MTADKTIVCWLWNDSALLPTAQELAPRRVAPAVPEITVDERARLMRLRARYPNRKFPELRRIKAPVVVAAKQLLPRMFDAEQVNVLQRMCARHMSAPHRFVCISDKRDGLSASVDWLQTPAEAKLCATIRSPEGERFPSCYRRLWVFSDAARVLGKRLLCIDVDLVVTASLDPLFAGTEPFMGWRPFRDWGRKLRFGGGTYRLDTGTRTHVWSRFRGAESAFEARNAGFRGSDQAWLSYCLAHAEPYWPRSSGIYSVRDLGPGLELPADARIVHFNGTQKPVHHKAGRVAAVQWVLDHWR